MFLIKKILAINIIILMVFSLAGCQDQIDPRNKQNTEDEPFERPDPDPNSPLISTRWYWGEWEQRYLYFETAETVIYTANGNPGELPYWYNKTTRRGEVALYGTFSVSEDYERLVFSPRWGNYMHDAPFTRVHE